MSTIEDVLAGRARWAVEHGDNSGVLARMPDKSVAHVITDPPYEAEAHAGARRRQDGAVVEYVIPFDPITPEQRDGMAREAVRLTAGWTLAFCQVEAVGAWRDVLVAYGAKWRRAGVWVKPDATPQFNGNGWAQGFECVAAAWCGPGRSEWNGGGARGVMIHNVNGPDRRGGDGDGHPTEKPLPLMLELVELFTDPDDLVLDPFAGSGTTGVACLRLGRRFIGIEKDATYHALAVERLTAEAQGLSLRDARHGQASLFGVGT